MGTTITSKKAPMREHRSFLKTITNSANFNPSQATLMFEFSADELPPVLPVPLEIVAAANDANPASSVPDVLPEIVATPNDADKQLPDKKTKRKPSKSTSTANQYAIIDVTFDYAGKLINTLDFRKVGVLHPAGRIKEMRERLGYEIVCSDLRTVYDDHGFGHPRIAFYELLSRPEKGLQ